MLSRRPLAPWPPAACALVLSLLLVLLADLAAARAPAAAQPAAPEAAAAPATPAAGDAAVRPGHWNKDKIPKGWAVLDTDHYQVQCEAGAEKAKLLTDHLESVNAAYQAFLPSKRRTETFVLKVFRSRKEFQVYGDLKSDSGTAAYYNSDSKELVGYDSGVILGKRDIPAAISLAPGCKVKLSDADKARLQELFEAITDAYTFDTARVLSHEGWHQYFHNYTVSLVAMPAWLDEGVGDYFFMATKDEQNSGNKSGFRVGDVNVYRLRTLRRALADGTATDFHTLLGFEQEQYYTNPSVFYAQGWSMVDFLLQNKDPVYRELIPKLIKDFKDSKNFRKSTDKIFHDYDMAALDKHWLGWVLSLPLVDPMMDLAREFGARLKREDLAADDRWLTVYKWFVDHPDYELGGTTASAAGQAAAPPANPPAAGTGN